MTVIDTWAAIAAGLAAACLALRGELLKPNGAVFATAPTLVFASLIGLSLLMATRVVSILSGSHATAWEALTASGLAASSAIMLGNLWRQRSKKAATAARHPGVAYGHPEGAFAQGQGRG